MSKQKLSNIMLPYDELLFIDGFIFASSKQVEYYADNGCRIFIIGLMRFDTEFVLKPMKMSLHLKQILSDNRRHS